MYQAQFQEMRIDGLLILDLEEEDIEIELKIKVKLHWKKIVKALELLQKYSDYLKKKQEPVLVLATQ
jgi:hypothetical protein